MKVLILVGGFAKRLLPLTADKAKALLPLAGKTVISHIVENIPAHWPIIVSTNLMFAPDFTEWQIEWQESHPDRDLKIFVEGTNSEETKKGALGAVGLAINELALNEDLLIIGGDNFFTFSLTDFINQTSGQPAVAAFDIANLEEAKKYGVILTNGKILTGFEEKPTEPKSSLVATCIYFIPKQYLPLVCEIALQIPDKIGGMFEQFLSQGVESHVYTFTGYWNDIGTFQAYVDAHIHAGPNNLAPESVTNVLHGNTLTGVNHIEPSCQISNSSIKDSIIMGGATITNCNLDTCIVDTNRTLENLTLKEEILK